MYYLVKWKGYPTSDNSWEPEKNLNADELIAEFKRSFRPKKTKGRKVLIRAGPTTQLDPSTSHLYHNTLILSKEMSSESATSLRVPSSMTTSSGARDLLMAILAVVEGPLPSPLPQTLPLRRFLPRN